MAARAIIVAFLCLIAPAAFAADCVRPEIEQFLEQSREAIQFDYSYFPGPSAQFLPFDADGQHLQWLGASWDSPPDGALFVLDCEGNRIAALPLGYVHELRAGPLVPGIGQIFEVIYTSESGTGELVKSVSLVTFENNAIGVLWDHEVSEDLSAPSLEIEYSDTFTWQFRDNGNRIEVAGEREVGPFRDDEHGWEPNTRHALPSESFCWNAAEKKYQDCSK